MSNPIPLFTPFPLRSVTARNRLWISPMCMYSVFAEDGIATDWHLAHYVSRAVGGAGLIIVEATAVEPRGRISARDLGLWDDGQIPALARIARLMADCGATPAVQLAHAGRKATVPGAVGPSPLPFSADYATPQALSQREIDQVILAFQQAARRAHAAGFQAVELHAAHGYLLHQFLSPLSNQRDDAYGGDFDSRTRLTLETVAAVRAVWPAELPLLVRISATDWAEGGWDLEQSVALARRLAGAGVDLLDVSSGGLTPTQQIRLGPGYQVPFAQRIRQETGLAVAAVGLINQAQQANAIVCAGQADAVLIARQSLRDPYWPLRAARELGAELAAPQQYLRGW
ncbi:MAG TPA: NADH:flavin oxidoreductase/NADH oxidase [Anaerolineae bacterium]|nr:NADH:flavin oxidoreductase/NADH oxidase [Anaerolineae bacterium]HNU02726.1 NADH:flavin oxidoreductase/NADH oxidase [Anaerolineae bacterium]